MLTHGFPRKQVKIVLLLLAYLCSHAGHVGAQSLYKSIAPGGKVIYSNRPPDGARVEKTLEFEDLPASQVKPQAAPPENVDLPADDVVLYAAAWCGYCRKAKAYLARKGVSYKEVDIDTAYGKSAFAQVGNGQGIPLLFAHGQRLQGYSEEAYEAVFANP